MKEADAGDVVRVARVYVEQREWSRARPPLFERSLAMDDYDEREAAGIGAYDLLNGDRATAEAGFDRPVGGIPKACGRRCGWPAPGSAPRRRTERRRARRAPRAARVPQRTASGSSATRTRLRPSRLAR